MSSNLCFGDAAELIKSTTLPTENENIRYIGLEHIEQNSLKINGFGNSRDVTSTKLTFKKNDILFGKLRPYFRKVVKAPFDGICSTDIWVVRAKNGVDQNFLFYWMASQDFIDHAMQGSEGTRMPRAKWEYVSRVVCPIINLEDQILIGKILSTLDEKIELNRKMSETLEDIASTLFETWFIDFDPVKAKAAGRQPEGLRPEIADLFPDAFTTNELPSGWHFSVAYDWAEYINGAAYKDSHFTESINGLPIIKIAELKSGISSGTKYSNINLGDKYKIDTGNILLSWSGSPETSIDTFLWVGGAGWLNQHIFNVIPKAPESRTFVYFLLKYLKQTLINIAKNKQTTGLGHITVKDLKELKVVNPGSKLIKSFDLIVAPILQRIQQSMEENVCLSRTRNNLLPKLISGEIQL